MAITARMPIILIIELSSEGRYAADKASCDARSRGQPDDSAEYSGAVAQRSRNDPAAPVHGPFSAGFRLVCLDGDDVDLIRCGKARANVFRALWEFHGKDRTAEEVMNEARRRSTKPIDVFKSHAEPLRAYKALVVTNQKEGLYRMRCAGR